MREALFRKSSDNFTNNVTFEFLVASWIHLTYIFLIGIDIAVVLSVREVQSVESDPEILSRLSQCLVTVFTLQHPKKILFDLKRREVPNLAVGWCDGGGIQAENYFESVDLNFKSGTAGWTHTKVYIMWFYVVVMGQSRKYYWDSVLTQNWTLFALFYNFWLWFFFKRNFFLLCFQCWNFCFGKEMDLEVHLITTKL